MITLEQVDRAVFRKTYRGLRGNPAARRMLQSLLPDGECVIKGRVFQMTPGSNSHDFNTWINDTLPEAASIARLSKHIEGRDVCFLDIGANNGCYCIHLADVMGPGARIHAFDPNPIILKLLRQNIEMNGLNERIKVHAYALGDEATEMPLYVHPQNLGQTSLRDMFADTASDTVMVKVRPLRSRITKADMALPLVIKIDVEGFEDRVLAPFFAEGSDLPMPEAILIEIAHTSQWQHNIIDDIHSAGFEQVFEGNGNGLFIHQSQDGT